MKGRIQTHDANTRSKLPIIGRISCGVKNKKGIPTSLDYFTATGNYAFQFAGAFGAEPSTIQVIFLEDDPRKVCYERYELRDDAGRLLAHGDGINFKVWSKGQYVDRVQTGDEDLPQQIYEHFKPKRGWSVVLTLTFLIPKINTVMGLWRFETRGAASSIPNIRESFDTVVEYRGTVRGVVFDLSVAKVKSQKPDDPSSYPVVTLIANNSDENVEQLNLGHMIENKNLLGPKNDG